MPDLPDYLSDPGQEGVKRWLKERAKLERYCDTLLFAGFDNLHRCAGIRETELDALGITLPGHRKRLLLVAKELAGQLAERPEVCGVQDATAVRSASVRSTSSPARSVSPQDRSLSPSDQGPLPPHRGKSLRRKNSDGSHESGDSSRQATPDLESTSPSPTGNRTSSAQPHSVPQPTSQRPPVPDRSTSVRRKHDVPDAHAVWARASGPSPSSDRIVSEFSHGKMHRDEADLPQRFSPSGSAAPAVPVLPARSSNDHRPPLPARDAPSVRKVIPAVAKENGSAHTFDGEMGHGRPLTVVGAGDGDQTPSRTGSVALRQERSSYDNFEYDVDRRGTALSRTSTVSSQTTGKSSGRSLQGYLWKTGGQKGDKKWQHRWMTFNGFALKYFKNQESSKDTDMLNKVSVKEMKYAQLVPDANDSKHPFHINLVTENRVFNLGAQDEDTAKMWVSVLTEAISDYQTQDHQAMNIEGGHMACPDKEGFLLKLGHNIRGDWKQRYVALKGAQFCYYNSHADFCDDHPINEINMSTAAVKPSGKNRFLLVTPQKSYEFQCEDAAVLSEWIEALQSGILGALASLDPSKGSASIPAESEQAILAKLKLNRSNYLCADCGAPDPTWASVNLCITLCIHCAGIHRSLGVSISKVRSVELDQEIWNDRLLELFRLLGNDSLNNFLMKNCRSDTLSADDEMAIRDLVIRSKYQCTWCDKHRNFGDKEILSLELCENVQTSDVATTRTLLMSGAQVNFGHPGMHPSCNTPILLARQAGQELQEELLLQHGADPAGAAGDVAVINDRDEETGRSSGVTGYLYKTGLGDRAWKRRWSVLDGLALRYYRSETDMEPAGNIPISDMLLASKTDVQDAPYQHCFQVQTTYGRIFNFCTETSDELEMWLSALTTRIAKGQEGKYLKSGWLLKRGATASTAYKRRWFTLDIDCNELTYHKEGEKDEAGTIDLRKMTRLLTFEDGSEDERSFQIVTSERTYYLQAETKENAVAWCKSLQSSLVFGVPLGEQKLSSHGVPWLVEKCLAFVETHGLLHEGVYRLSGSKLNIEKLKASFSADASSVLLDLDVYQVDDVTGVLKEFFRKLPDPLLTAELYDTFIQASGVPDHDSKLYAMQDCIHKLPAVNGKTLKKVIGHLAKVAEMEEVNKMGVKNLIVIFGPTLMTTEVFAGRGLSYASKEWDVIFNMITYYQWLFEISAEEIAEEERVKTALALIKDAPKQRNVLQEFILEVFIGPRKMSRSVNIKVGSTMSADQLAKQICEKHQLADTELWWCFVSLFGGEAERPLTLEEKVLSASMGWQADMNMCLVVQTHPLLAQLRALRPAQNHTGYLFVKDKKNPKKWQKRFFIFTNGVLTYHKDQSSTELGRMEMSDHQVFIGMELKKLQPSTKMNFTIYSKASLADARYICAEEQHDYLVWLKLLFQASGIDFNCR